MLPLEIVNESKLESKVEGQRGSGKYSILGD